MASPTCVTVFGGKFTDRWATVEAATKVFWETTASVSDVKRLVVDIFKTYNKDIMKAGRAYLYGKHNFGGFQWRPSVSNNEWINHAW